MKPGFVTLLFLVGLIVVDLLVLASLGGGIGAVELTVLLLLNVAAVVLWMRSRRSPGPTTR